MARSTRLVIADDLTGANDTGVHFLTRERPVTVVVDSTGTTETPAAETVVINTNTRFATASDAYRTVRDSITRYLAMKPDEICKKVDSTLRGNVGAEIDAVLDAGAFRVACVAPATPRNGRTVSEGRCFVNGVPLDATEIATDRFTPVDESDVRKIIARQSARRSVLLPLSILRENGDGATGFVHEAIRNGTEIVVCDAETVGDLRKTRDIFAALGESVLFVGSAGLFHAMDGSDEGPFQPEIPTTPGHVSKALFVVGSLMQTTMEQVQHLRNHTDTGFYQVDNELLGGTTPERIQGMATRVCAELERHNAVVVQSAYPTAEIGGGSSRMASTMGRIVNAVVARGGIGLVVATGGDTALHVLKEMKVSLLDLVGEALPGIAIATVETGHPAAGTLFATKAGSYGNADALTYLFNHMVAREQRGAQT
jgi:uncharacterized protein YgbK (DUF1537 family)